MKNKKPLYEIGELFTEFVDGIDLSSGIITDYYYSKSEKDFLYIIKWNDMYLETELMESIIKWRIENDVFVHYKIIR